MVRTYQPKKRHRSKVHGFRKRMATTAARFWLAVVPRAASASPTDGGNSGNIGILNKAGARE